MIDPEGRKRAREVAQWELGDPSWADVILDAYESEDDPRYQEAHEELVKDD